MGGCLVYRKVISMLLIVCAVFTGCGVLKPKRGFEEASRRLLSLEAYSCDVIMRVTNNKSTMQYRLKHFYKAPDRYRIEVLEPKELEGQITIYNGSSSYIYHPGINQYLVTENFSGSMDYIAFTGSFLNYMRKNEHIKAGNERIGEKEFIVLELELPEPNEYMRSEKLWLDTDKFVPIKAEIYGDDGKINIEVTYDNFVYNPDLKDGDFEITQKNSIRLQEMKENVRSEENQGCMGGGGPGCTCPQHKGSEEACTEGCTCNGSD